MVHWMIFRPEGADVLYLWTDASTDVNLIHVGPHEGENKDWYWSVTPAGQGVNIAGKEIILLNLVTVGKQRIFKVPRVNNRRYQVVERGTYNYVNT